MFSCEKVELKTEYVVKTNMTLEISPFYVGNTSSTGPFFHCHVGFSGVCKWLDVHDTTSQTMEIMDQLRALDLRKSPHKGTKS